MGIKIIGSGYYLPETIAANEDFAKLVDTSDEWITSRTGIKRRHIANGELTYQMGAKASAAALKNAQLRATDIDMVLGTTVTSDFLTPSMACMVAKELGIEKAVCFDINAACAAYVFALDMAHKYLLSGEYKNILIVSSETVTGMVDYSDRATCVLFGDGAAATIITKSDTLFSSYIDTNPQGADKIFTKLPRTENPFKTAEDKWDDDNLKTAPLLFMQMAGNEVYKFATVMMPLAIEEAAKRANLELSDIDLVIPHQANIRIVQTAIKRLNMPPEKFYINIENFGNISSACIPLGIAQLMENKKIKEGDKICLVGFGAGLVYGATIFEM